LFGEIVPVELCQNAAVKVVCVGVVRRDSQRLFDGKLRRLKTLFTVSPLSFIIELLPGGLLSESWIVLTPKW
jgi:hypothetical protein